MGSVLLFISLLDEIAKELGGAQDVHGVLEGDGVEGHADTAETCRHS